MKLKLGELQSIVKTLPKVMEKDLPGGKTSYWLARALMDITKEFQPFEDTRKKMIGKYGRRYTKDKKVDGKLVEKKGELVLVEGKDEDGNKVSTYSLTDQKAFNKEFLELAEQEIEIKYEPRPIDDFIVKDKEGKESCVLTGMEIIGLGRLIKRE